MRVLDPGSVGFRCTDHHARLRLLDYMDRFYAPTQTRLQGQEVVMNFVLRYGGNRIHAGANPDLIRSQTLTIRPTEYLRLVLNVPITRVH